MTTIIGTHPTPGAHLPADDWRPLGLDEVRIVGRLLGAAPGRQRDRHDSRTS